MADNINDDGNDNSGGALRKQLEDALAKLAKANERLDKFETKEMAESVAEKLKANGLDPRAAKFVSKEDATDPARLDAWMKENSEMFKVGDGTAPEAQTSGKPSVDPATANEFNRIQQVSQNGAHNVSDVSALQAQIKNANSPEELANLMANLIGG